MIIHSFYARCDSKILIIKFCAVISEDSGISGSYDRLGHKSVCFLLLPIFYLNLIFQTKAKIHTALQMRHF